MIITRSPLRITLGGGGTDLPSYYRENDGFLIAAGITNYIYVTLNKAFIDDCIIKYSKTERVNDIDEIEHPIIREALKLTNTDIRGLEISSLADIPSSGTGLGSSGSFTTALLKALHHYNNRVISPKQLAEQACYIEMDILKEPLGKQDQYIAAYGGLSCFEFNKDGSVNAYPLNVSKETLYNLEDNLILFFTGYSRSASSILKEQDDATKKDNKEMIENLHFIKDLGYKGKVALENNELEEYANLMNIHWDYKKKRSSSMSNTRIDYLYNLAMKNGAISGKLIGAGNGGFLLFYCSNKKRLRESMAKEQVKELRFRIESEGTKIISV